MYRNLLPLINIKALAFAVIAPIIALAGASGYIIAKQKRTAVEQTVEQSVIAMLHATERELSKHLSAAEILASMVDLNRLETFTVRMNEVMMLRRSEWLNVIIMDENTHIYNFVRHQRNEPLQETLNPELNQKVLKSGRYDISPVLTSERYPEPYISIRVPIIEPGTEQVSHVLTVVVRAWSLSLTAQSLYTPEQWRFGVLDPKGAIAGRTDALTPQDAYIGKVTPLWLIPPHAGLSLAKTIDQVSLYVERAVSDIYPGWSATVGVPQQEVDRAVYEIAYTAGATGFGIISLACLLCFVLIRAYAQQQTTEALQDSLREKEILLREVHHRVKNNMQATMGVLLFERSRITDPQCKERLAVISDRIAVQGRVHQHLYEKGDLHRIELGAFLSEVCQGTMDSLHQNSPNIKLTLDTDILHSDIDLAMPLGLIANELMTNAVKHGFKDRDSGEIIVQLKHQGDEVCLTIKDTGHGGLNDEGPNGNNTHSHGIGMTLINGLVRQVDGEFSLAQDLTGTTATVRIRRMESSEQT